eukprot:gene8235-11144_t
MYLCCFGKGKKPDVCQPETSNIILMDSIKKPSESNFIVDESFRSCEVVVEAEGIDTAEILHNGFASLYTASSQGQVEVVQSLLSSRTNMEAKNEGGFTSLMFAAQFGHMSLMELLLLSSASLEAWQSLFLAASNDRKECVKLLLDHGAETNSANNEGYTALTKAVSKGYLEVVELLLSYNAKIDIQTNEGKSPLYLASCNGFGHIQKRIMAAINNRGEKMPHLNYGTNNYQLDMDESSYESELKRLNLPVNWFLFDVYHVWQTRQANTRQANQSDSESASSSLGSNRISYDYFQKILSDYSYTMESIDHSGCKIDKTENRGITIRQLQLVMNEIRKRCNMMKDKWKKHDGRNLTNETITPENANLYDINGPIIKGLTKDIKSSFVERVANGDQQPSDLIRRANAVGFSSDGPLLRDIHDHMIILAGISENDSNIAVEDIRNNRQVWFPEERIRKAIQFDVKGAQATAELDRVHILNAIIGKNGSDLNALPPDNHDSYDNLNTILQVGFAGLNNFSIGSKDPDNVRKYCDCLSKSNKSELSFDFEKYNINDANDQSLVISYLNALPKCLIRFKASWILTGFESTKTLFSLPSQLQCLQYLVIDYIFYDDYADNINTLCESIQSPSCRLARLEILRHGLKPAQLEQIQSTIKHIHMSQNGRIIEFIHTHRGGSLHAQSKAQSLTTKSSFEAELVVSLSDYGAPGYEVQPARIEQDNQGTMAAIQKGKNPPSGRSRHINIRYFWQTDLIKSSDEVTVNYVPTDLMISDILTKPLQGEKFKRFRNKLL